MMCREPTSVTKVKKKRFACTQFCWYRLALYFGVTPGWTKAERNSLSSLTRNTVHPWTNRAQSPYERVVGRSDHLNRNDCRHLSNCIKQDSIMASCAGYIVYYCGHSRICFSSVICGVVLGESGAEKISGAGTFSPTHGVASNLQ